MDNVLPPPKRLEISEIPFPQGKLSTACGFVNIHFSLDKSMDGKAQKVPFGAKNMHLMQAKMAGIRREEVEYEKEWDFAHSHVDVRAIRPQVFQRPKGRRIKGLRRFSTASTTSTPTADLYISTPMYSWFGRRCISAKSPPNDRKFPK